MRISDWSSDVSSSDLNTLYKGQPSLLANCYHRPTAYRTHIRAAIDIDGIPALVSAVSGAVAIRASASSLHLRSQSLTNELIFFYPPSLPELPRGPIPAVCTRRVLVLKKLQR